MTPRERARAAIENERVNEFPVSTGEWEHILTAAIEAAVAEERDSIRHLIVGFPVRLLESGGTTLDEIITVRSVCRALDDTLQARARGAAVPRENDRG